MNVTKFYQIKDKTGTRFKCCVLDEKEKPIIVKHYNNDKYYVYFENDNSILDVDQFSDEMAVEVINETETN